MITLISKDGQDFQIEENVGFKCETIKNLIEDGLASSDSEIPISDINGNILQKVIEYGTYRFKNDFNEEWNTQFCNMSQTDLFDTILAANYLEYVELLDTCCTAIAKMISGKTPQEIRKIFNIQNDFTEEEEKQIRKENEWIDE